MIDSLCYIGLAIVGVNLGLVLTAFVIYTSGPECYERSGGVDDDE